MAQPQSTPSVNRLVVDVIIPVHNAAPTIRSTVQSAMCQVIPTHLESFFSQTTATDGTHNNKNTVNYLWDVAVCCFDDGSTDESWGLLMELKREYDERQTFMNRTTTPSPCAANDDADNGLQQPRRTITCKLLIARGTQGSRGAGYARNQAAVMRSKMLPESPAATSASTSSWLCWLDSDDIMHPTRIAEQVHCLMCLQDDDERERTLLGCTFDRDPPDATWHYAKWANELTDERLYLERFREVTLLQPTWMMSRSRWHSLGGYIEAPNPVVDGDNDDEDESTPPENTTAPQPQQLPQLLRLIHPIHDTPQTLRLAEDLRFFHTHLDNSGLLKLLRTKNPLVTYRHRAGMSQSSNTPRKLLLQLRVLAFETCILRRDPKWSGSFAVWGAGRDGKDFIKTLADDMRKRIMCLVDIDAKKIDAGYYVNGNIRIPIVHFSWLAQDPTACRRMHEESDFEAIRKGSKPPNDTSKEETTTDNSSSRPSKKLRTEQSLISVKTPVGLDLSQLPSLPVVVCVAMYRTNGALEQNVKSIGRTEGQNLWHFN